MNEQNQNNIPESLDPSAITSTSEVVSTPPVPAKAQPVGAKQGLKTPINGDILPLILAPLAMALFGMWYTWILLDEARLGGDSSQMELTFVILPQLFVTGAASVATLDFGRRYLRKDPATTSQIWRSIALFEMTFAVLFLGWLLYSQHKYHHLGLGIL